MRMHLRGHRRGYEYHSCQRRCSAGHCPAPTFIAATRLEMCVEDVVLDLLSRRRRPPDSAVHAAEDTGKVAQRRPAAYRDSDRVLATLGDDAYAAGLAARVQRVREASLTLADERTRRDLHEPPATAAIESAWPAMDVAQRREIIRRVIDCVFVQPGQSRPPARPRPPRLGRGPARRPAQPVKLDLPRPRAAPVVRSTPTPTRRTASAGNPARPDLTRSARRRRASPPDRRTPGRIMRRAPLALSASAQDSASVSPTRSATSGNSAVPARDESPLPSARTSTFRMPVRPITFKVNLLSGRAVASTTTTLPAQADVSTRAPASRGAS
jgi:hypothetical protein